MLYFITRSVFAKRCKVEHLDITSVDLVFQKRTAFFARLSPFFSGFKIVTTTIQKKEKATNGAGRDFNTPHLSVLGGNPQTLKLRCSVRNFLLGIARCQRQALYRLPALSSWNRCAPPYLKKNTKLCEWHLKPSATLEYYPSVHFQGSKKIPCLLKYINVFNEIRNAYKCVVTARIIAACQPKAFSDISHTYSSISHCTSFTPHICFLQTFKDSHRVAVWHSFI